MLTVLSYNILFGKRLEKIVTWLNNRDQSFDIICLQEFPYSKIAILDTLKDRKIYHESYAVSFHKGKEAYGLLTLINTQKIKFKSEQTIYIGTSILEKAMGRQIGRNALVTNVTYKRKHFTLVNAHLAAISSNGHRRKQLTTVVSELEKDMIKGNRPTLILGDFNYTSLLWQKRLLMLMEEYGYTNAYSHNTHRLLFVKKQQLDYVFYKYGFVQDIQIGKEKYSDHQPISFVFSPTPI